ncbi:MAG TPA: YihY/virulence factor BrkB family protein [Candidatus Mediterraneibacter norfolkensis]|nr:YihY/virulence factor BrkB family protein [Candidatus Mediterraneibacter norfolkensis]
MKNSKIVKTALNISKTINSHHTGAYAAQAAYFFMLSLIPIIMLLLTMVTMLTNAGYDSLIQNTVLEAITRVFPTSVAPLIRGIVIQIRSQFKTIIPVTVIAALWSAGKGVLSVSSGLNCIYDNTETRNYFYLRLRSSLYTVIFLMAILLSLVLSVFGNSISVMLYEHLPFLSRIVDFVIRIRTIVSLVVLTLFWDLVYKFLPNRRNMKKTTFRKQLPGALFTACGWLLISFVFSVYLDIFTGFSNLYGSFTTIVLIMLWLYGCMYIILLGGEVNALLERFRGEQKV